MTFSEFKEKYQTEEVTEVPNSAPANPVVSVLVQTFQHKDYISQCLDNILAQETDFPFEILLGEDASTDGTREICIEYAEKFPDKIRLFLHRPGNKIKILGITTGNFNALYNYYSAKGKFIAFCEGDDFWTDPLKLQKQVSFLETYPDFNFCYHPYEEQHKDSSRNANYTQPNQDISSNELEVLKVHPLLQTLCFHNGKMEIPREMLEVVNVDSFMFSLLGKYGPGKFLSNIKPSIYRRHSNGTWSSRPNRIKYPIKVRTFQKLQAYYKRTGNDELFQIFRIKLFTTYKMWALEELTNLEVKKAFKIIWKLRKTLL